MSWLLACTNSIEERFDSYDYASSLLLQDNHVENDGTLYFDRLLPSFRNLLRIENTGR
jgi:hypothetical protein